MFWRLPVEAWKNICLYFFLIYYKGRHLLQGLLQNEPEGPPVFRLLPGSAAETGSNYWAGCSLESPCSQRFPSNLNPIHHWESECNSGFHQQFSTQAAYYNHCAALQNSDNLTQESLGLLAWEGVGFVVKNHRDSASRHLATPLT